VVSHTPIEIETLGNLQAAHDWVDLGRRFVPAPDRCFTWWSYRSPDWTRNDRGRRLDHMWASPILAPQVTAHAVHEPCRGWERPSDHVPLVLELSL
jgi:exodeoxyribonuclease-3